jgi:hypothetical protein
MGDLKGEGEEGGEDGEFENGEGVGGVDSQLAPEVRGATRPHRPALGFAWPRSVVRRLWLSSSAVSSCVCVACRSCDAQEQERRALRVNVACMSRAGREPGFKKTNQDNCFAFEKFVTEDQSLFGAMDGHGPHGAFPAASGSPS